MIDLTPLEVRKKKGDFRRAMRGYDPALVDDFLDLVADRLDQLVRENLTLQERVARQDEQVTDYRDRERALTEALVSAQEMREEVRRQSSREAELAKQAAEQYAGQLRARVEEEVRQLRGSAQHELAQELASIRLERQREEDALRHLRARQQEFLTSYRTFLEQELAELGVMSRAPVAAPRSTRPPAGRPATGAQGAPRQTPPRAADVAVPQPVTDSPLDGLAEADVAEEAAYVLGAAAGERMEEPFELEPFEPEAFVEDESILVAEALSVEETIPFEGAAPGESDATEVSGAGAELRLYDAIAADEAGTGAPGAIGLGADASPWSSPPEWSLAGVDLAGSGDTDEIDLEDDDDPETAALLRNAAAAGYRLDDADDVDELLLDEPVSDEAEPKGPKDDGWLPTLLEDDK